VLRVPSNFTFTVAAGTKITCAEAVTALLKHPRRWEVRSAGSGSKGERWYAWAWLATASARHHLLIRRHLQTGELAFHYCFVPGGQLLTPPPVRPGQPPPPEPGMIPLTIPEIKRLLAALTTRPLPRWLVIHWDAWTRRHQARARWFHKRTRLARQPEFAQVKL
jgi:hypothetical protein